MFMWTLEASLSLDDLTQVLLELSVTAWIIFFKFKKQKTNEFLSSLG